MEIELIGGPLDGNVVDTESISDTARATIDVPDYEKETWLPLRLEVLGRQVMVPGQATPGVGCYRLGFWEGGRAYKWKERTQ